MTVNVNYNLHFERVFSFPGLPGDDAVAATLTVPPVNVSVSAGRVALGEGGYVRLTSGASPQFRPFHAQMLIAGNTPSLGA